MRPKKFCCVDCGVTGDAARKGPVRLRCGPCAKRRALTLTRDSNRAKNGLPPRPSTVVCSDCSSAVAVKAKGPIPNRCAACAHAHHVKSCTARLRSKPELAKRYKRASYERHADKYREYGRKHAAEWYYNNRQRVLDKLRSRPYEEKLAHAAKQRERRQKNPELVREKDCQRYREDIQYRLACVLRARVRPLMAGSRAAGSCVRDLGISVSGFRLHIESQFTGDMSWQNYGIAWELDHIYPLSACDLTDRVQFLAVCNYRNYRPLSPEENLAKGARVLKEAESLFAELLIYAKEKASKENGGKRRAEIAR